MKMALETLDRMAYDMQVLPPGLEMPETYYFLSMRALYAAFLAGRVDGQQAKEEKRSIIRTYRAFELVHRIGTHDIGVLRKIQQHKNYYNKNGCAVCRQLADEICGLAIELTDAAVKGGA